MLYKKKNYFSVFFIFLSMLMIISCDDLSESLTSGLSDVFDNSQGVSDDLVQVPTGAYTITYYFNNGTGTSVDSQVKKNQKSSLSVPDESAAPVGKKFAGWVTDMISPTAIYLVGKEYDLSLYAKQENADEWKVKLYAYWINKDDYLVVYHANGAMSGKLPVIQIKSKGKELTIADSQLAKEGQLFYAWNTKKTGDGITYDARYRYKKQQSLVLYAKWILPREKPIRDMVITPTGIPAPADRRWISPKGFDYIVVTNENELEMIKNSNSQKYILWNDIVLTNDNFTPLSDIQHPFKGVLEGNGKSIIGLKIIQENSNSVGLFGVLSQSSIVQNLILDSPIVKGGSFVGGLVGKVIGKGAMNIEIVYVGIHNAKITTTSSDGVVGSLVGMGSMGIISSYAQAEVTASGMNAIAGGLVGKLEQNGKIYRSYATGTVEAINGIAGGLTGMARANSNIVNSYATASVRAAKYAGGAIGFADNQIQNIYATGHVSLTDTSGAVGGLVGNSDSGFVIIIVDNALCYFDADSSAQNRGVGKGSGNDRVLAYRKKDLIGMHKFPNWDFMRIWQWKGNSRWPILKWQSAAP